MAVIAGPNKVTNGLVFHIDAQNPKGSSGTTVYDLSSKAYAVTSNNIAISGGAIQIRNTGTAPYQSLSTSFNEGVLKATNQAGTWSLEAFFKNISAPTSGESWVIGRIGCHGGIYLYANGSNTDVYHAIKTASCWTGAVNKNLVTLTPNQICHSVMTYNNGTIKSYINGVLTSTNVLDIATYGTQPYSDELRIGGWTSNGSYGVNIDLYSASCYTTELSAAQIQQNFAANRGRYGI